MWMWMWDGCRDESDPFCFDYHLPYWVDLLENVQKYTDDVVLSFAPTGDPQGELLTYARGYTSLLKQLDDEFARQGLPRITVTGLANEPDVGDKLIREEVPQLIKWYRRELDATGLEHVKIIGPENSGCNNKTYAWIDAITSDAEALASLDGFASHSYNESVTEEMEERVIHHVLNNGKEYWMTEASDMGPETWEDGEQATSTISRFLADMNHLVNVWIFFLGAKPVESDWGAAEGKNRYFLAPFRKEEQDWRPLLKTYYIKQLNRTLDLHCRFRKAHTSLYDPDGRWWRREDSTMVFAFGEKAPVYIAAAVNPDGSWAIGITNYTGEVDPRPWAQVRSTTVFDATVHVEELADKGDIAFTVHRCDNSAPYIHEEGTVTMRNGEVGVTLEPMTFVTLRSAPGTATPQLMQTRRTRRVRIGSSLRVHHREGLPVEIRFTVDGTEGRTRLAVYSLRGAKLCTLLDRHVHAGQHSVVWQGDSDSGERLPSGSYVVSLRRGEHAAQRQFMFVR
jgi:hypothetical protein